MNTAFLSTTWWRRTSAVKCVDCGEQAVHLVSTAAGTVCACERHVRQYLVAAERRHLNVGGLGVVETSTRINWSMQLPTEFSIQPPDWREETLWDTLKSGLSALLAGVSDLSNATKTKG